MKTAPLAETFRPRCLEHVVGQEHLLGSNGLITKMIQSKRPLSLLLWGPPGCGKTTLARLYAQAFDSRFIAMSAIFTSASELKKIFQEIEENPLLYPQTLLFIDEIHRFNKAQQDVFLPFVEKGTIVLIGATTENPSFALNNALLSRLRVLKLNPLCFEHLDQLISRWERSSPSFQLTDKAKHLLITSAQGDARHLLNLIENLDNCADGHHLIDEKLAEALLQKRAAHYDRQGDGHYQLISALHKSVRGSDPDAALYWLSRMLEGGEDPQFIARRIVRMAVEDIGLSDPQALEVALNAWKAFDQLGLPEGELGLAQAIVYLSLAPKSNAIYTAYAKARNLAQQTTHLPPPEIILNAPTTLMKEMGYGKDYEYDHDTPLGFSGQNYFPKEIERQSFYVPKELGFEREMKKRIDYFNRLRKEKNLPLKPFVHPRGQNEEEGREDLLFSSGMTDKL